MVQIITRQIQYFGILQLPPKGEIIKWWRLTFDLLKPPLSTYRNDRYPVPQGFWGYVQAISNQRVMQTWGIDYENQIIADYSNTNVFLHQSISCHLEAVLTSFVNLGLALNLPPIQRNNPIKDWVAYAQFPDRFRVKLLTPDTYCKLTFEYDFQEVCTVLGSTNPIPPPPPLPPPEAPLPPDTPPQNIPPNSPSYDGVDDNGETFNPGPDDPVNPDFPQGDRCKIYRVTVVVRLQGETDPFPPQAGLYFGEIEDVFLGNTPAQGAGVFVVAHGKPGGTCTDTIQTFKDLVVGEVAEIIEVTVTEEII
jgi:hypothetical protein